MNQDYLDRVMDRDLDRVLDRDPKDEPVYTFIVQYNKSHYTGVHCSVESWSCLENGRSFRSPHRNFQFH